MTDHRFTDHFDRFMDNLLDRNPWLFTVGIYLLAAALAGAGIVALFVGVELYRLSPLCFETVSLLLLAGVVGSVIRGLLRVWKETE